jgi:hypothetical protein
VVDRLFVIIGAGASYDCAPAKVVEASGKDYYWPPLTTELFLPRQFGFAPILAKYPLAKAAAAELGSTQTAVSIETQLRERYRDSKHEHDRRIFRGVLPYLQELLYTVSHQFTPFPQNYEVLVTKLLRLKEIVFVSLNYDLLLDNALVAADPDKSDMDWYISPGPRNWSLIKLHGSVDWGRRLLSPRGRDDFIAPNAESSLASEITLRTNSTLDEIRGLPPLGSPPSLRDRYFPALAAPVGQADELVCPPKQVSFLKERLAQTQPMHLLVIGYSGIDKEVVTLIRDSERGVKTLTIVDRDEDSARAVAERLQGQGVGGRDTKISVANGGFNHWIRDGQFEMFLKQMQSEPF